MIILDKNGKKITSKGFVKGPKGIPIKVHDGDDGNLWVFLDSQLFPLLALDPSSLEFIEE